VSSPYPQHGWLTIEEAAEYAVHWKPRTITNWIDAGGRLPESQRLKSRIVAGRRVTRREWIDAFLEGKPPPSDDDEEEPSRYRELTYADLAELRVPVFGTTVDPVADVDIAKGLRDEYQDL
jgi:hypothetical protein